MSDALKIQLESFLLTFAGSFVVAIGTTIASGSIDFAHLSGGIIVSTLIAAVQTAFKVAWNKTHYGNVAGVKEA